MNRKAGSGIMLILLLTSILTLTFDIQPVRASGTIYIRADGSVEPDTASISSIDNVTYTFTGNIHDSIVVERSNIIVDGTGYTLQGSGSEEWGYGFNLTSISNVTIKNMNIKDFWYGVYLKSSSNNTVSGNNITNNNNDAIIIHSSSDNSISGNNITTNTMKGINLYKSSDNEISHNNFINNMVQVTVTPGYANIWDDGYPSGGNYWSDYEEKYPYAEELDGSGIWDTPYVIDESNQDNYPLMEPWTPTPSIPTAINELKIEIEELGSQGKIDNHGIATSLLAKLNVAQKLIDNGKIDQAENILNAFINEVQAQSGKHITPDAADILIESAEYIISHL